MESYEINEPIFVWNSAVDYSKQEEIVSELPAGMNFDLHWYPKIPGLVSASSFEGNVGFYNIEGHKRLNAGEAFVDSGIWAQFKKQYSVIF
ncbi:protein transport protein SEC31 homolog B-like [Papaver somniferum]|uniref:protein transport protein SEC31 homolog B-like n=1 Tax=Papaver somniferum TaxID=3469 RepID=UPI000E6F590F|nr:protein transport protein SEC31 homolog B-like [Papaver somniferum]XP_026435759.1 protein transport protein SEC31 homolog B-like [Papaver somniferum]